MAEPRAGMTALTIEPKNFDEIIERSKDNEYPYTREQLEELMAQHAGLNKVGLVVFFTPEFWRQADE